MEKPVSEEVAMMGNMRGKVALIAGSTSGIGLGIARAFANAGANIVLNGFGQADEIETIRTDLKKIHGVQVLYSNADMSKASAIEEMIHTTAEKFDRLDVLVNNAGIQHVAPIESFPPGK